MTAANISLLNAVLLIVIGGAGYLLPADPSLTALIPVGFGLAIAACNPGLRKNNKLVAHIAVVLTLLILVGLAMPLRGAIGREDTAAIIRVGIMLAVTLLSLIVMFRTFTKGRRERVAT